MTHGSEHPPLWPTTEGEPPTSQRILNQERNVTREGNRAVQ
jgi:hypothetical protein